MVIYRITYRRERAMSRFYRLRFKMEYPINGAFQGEVEGEVPYLLKKLVIDLENTSFMQIDQSSLGEGETEADSGCTLMLSGNRSIEMSVEMANKALEAWLNYNGYEETTEGIELKETTVDTTRDIDIL